MSDLKRLLEEAKQLPTDDRARLVKLLAETPGGEDDEYGVVARGLDAWTQSVSGEDWSAFYPPSLRSSSRNAK